MATNKYKCLIPELIGATGAITRTGASVEVRDVGGHFLAVSSENSNAVVDGNATRVGASIGVSDIADVKAVISAVTVGSGSSAASSVISEINGVVERETTGASAMKTQALARAEQLQEAAKNAAKKCGM